MSNAELIIKGFQVGTPQRVGTYGTTVTYGPPSGIEISPALKTALRGTGSVTATFEGMKLSDPATQADVYLIQGGSDELSFENFVGSLAPAGTKVELEVKDWKTTDSEGLARSFLARDAVTHVSLVVIFRKGDPVPFERFVLAAR